MLSPPPCKFKLHLDLLDFVCYVPFALWIQNYLGRWAGFYQKKVWATCIVILATSMHSTNTLAVTKLAYLESVFAADFIGCYCAL